MRRMAKSLNRLGAAVLLLIPIGSYLAMFDIVQFTGKAMGIFIMAYLSLVLAILTYRIFYGNR